MSVKEKTKTKFSIYLSKRYRVVFLDDNKTTFKFVEDCLTSIFGKTKLEARLLANQINEEGSAIAGSGYLLDVAKTKQSEVLRMAKIEGFPFEVIVEEE